RPNVGRRPPRLLPHALRAAPERAHSPRRGGTGSLLVPSRPGRSGRTDPMMIPNSMHAHRSRRTFSLGFALLLVTTACRSKEQRHNIDGKAPAGDSAAHA